MLPTNGGPMRICDMSHDDLDAFFSGIAKKGAAQALKAIGLDDEEAGHDIKDIRSLLGGLRVVKSNALGVMLKGAGKLLGWALLVFLAGHFLDTDKLLRLGKEVF